MICRSELIAPYPADSEFLVAFESERQEIKQNGLIFKYIMYRKCRVCNGKGSTWGIPKLLNLDSNGPVTHPEGPQFDQSRDSALSYGLSNTCWRCLGRGTVKDDQFDGKEPF